jgi:hypothetical protein
LSKISPICFLLQNNLYICREASETSRNFYKSHLSKVIRGTFFKWLFFIPIKMRKAINFFRSYYDIAQELSDQDRLLFYDALLNKQFENKETNLTGMSKFAYLSQKHSIDAQIKGYYDKTKDEKFNPSGGGTVGGVIAPSVQEKEQEKEKEQVKEQVQDIILLKKETKPKISIDERKQYFKDRLIEIVKKENIDVIIAKEFFEYWTEPNQTNTKMKFELEKTYDITRRLNTWLQNNIKFNKTNTGNNGKSRTDIQQEGKDRFREKFNQQNFGDWNRD